jgi:hypothetical protein
MSVLTPGPIVGDFRPLRVPRILACHDKSSLGGMKLSLARILRFAEGHSNKNCAEPSALGAPSSGQPANGRAPLHHPGAQVEQNDERTGDHENHDQGRE